MFAANNSALPKIFAINVVQVKALTINNPTFYPVKTKILDIFLAHTVCNAGTCYRLQSREIEYREIEDSCVSVE